MSRSPLSIPYSVLALIIAVGAVAIFLTIQPPKPIMSRWNAASAGAQAIGGEARAEAAPAPLGGVAQPFGSGQAMLESYAQASALREDVGGGQVRMFQRDVAGGALDFVVVRLGGAAQVAVVNADGATPASDAGGDTVWADGQRHLRTVQEMAAAPYAARPGRELLGAMAFGFHGDVRTSDEGSVVIDGKVLRSNPGRATLCIGERGAASIGMLSTKALGECQQAIGGGPVILWEGRVASTDVDSVQGDLVPFNPLGEDFVLLDWRKHIYTGTFPKTAACVGLLDSGESYLVLANATNMVGVDMAHQLRDMGCYAALGGDDDTSTQLVWRGQLVREKTIRPVPDAIAVYIRQ